MFGYFAGPAVHVVDVLALGDALLARLPSKPNWRIGHFERPVPAGYIATIETGRNRIEDTTTAMLYERIKAVTQDPLWSRRRWRAIATLNW
jgi:arabinofuranosyltransferase